jgi:acyl-[acyl-carrier-protein] desaturase
MNDAALLQELGPTAEQLLERHIAASREWFPHELVPWGRGRDFVPGEPFDPSAAGLPEAVRSALLVNLLTEDNLPHYLRAITARFGDVSPWREWAYRWTAEEARHAIVMRDYLTVTRSIDLHELERARMAQVSCGAVPTPDSAPNGMVYVALQELATRISHRNTGQLLDAAGREVMCRVAADENQHHLFYRDLVSKALEIDPSRMTAAIEHEVRHFAMPGAGIPGFKAHAKLIANAGVYNFSLHHRQILVPLILKHWRITYLEKLNSAAEQARDRLTDYIDRVGVVAKRVAARGPAVPAHV